MWDSYVCKLGRKKRNDDYLFIFGVSSLFVLCLFSVLDIFYLNIESFFSWARRPCIKLMENQPAPMTMSTKHVEAIRYIKKTFCCSFRIDVFSSYNGPYTEAENDDVGIVSGNNITPTFSRSNSLKKQHVHWPDGSKIENFHSTTAHQQSFSGGNILNTTMLTESPSSHRRSNGLPITSSALSHFIQTAIIPAGSTVGNTGASQLLTPSKDLTSISAGYNSIV